MSDIKSKIDNIKETATTAAKNAAQSETVDKIKQSAGNIADKINSNETVSNAKDKVKELSDKVQENEKVAAAVEKINSNEYVQKAKNSKHSKLIKYGAILVAIILVFSLGKAIFKDKYAAKAEQAVISAMKDGLSSIGATDIKVSAKAIAKNAEEHLYLVDLSVSAKSQGSKQSVTSFEIVYSDSDTALIMQEIEYTKENKSAKKEVALSVLSRG